MFITAAQSIDRINSVTPLTPQQRAFFMANPLLAEGAALTLQKSGSLPDVYGAGWNPSKITVTQSGVWEDIQSSPGGKIFTGALIAGAGAAAGLAVSKIPGARPSVSTTYSLPGAGPLPGTSATVSGSGSGGGFLSSLFGSLFGGKPSPGGNASSNPSPTIMQQKAGAVPGGVSPAQASINPQGNIGGKTAMVAAIGIVGAISLAFAFKGAH